MINYKKPAAITGYNSWRAMRERCRNPNYRFYHRYGGRGIKVCERWNSFEAFHEDMGDKPTLKHELDRINNDGDYEPDNCRWTDGLTQRNNTSRNRFVIINGESKTVAQWCRVFEINPTTPYNRIREGWSMEKALTTPLNGLGVNFTKRSKRSVVDCRRCKEPCKGVQQVYCSRLCYTTARFHEQ